MKLCVVNFSISNGGDFLIERRMNSLIKKTWPDAEITYINGVNSKFDRTKRYDAVIGGGGPYYDDRIIEHLFIPFFGEEIKDIKFHLIGSGVYGEDFLDSAVYNKTFSNKTLRFFRSIEENGGTLSCRDVLSWQILRNNGIKKLYMTGCPAWYDFDFIDGIEPKVKNGCIRKIVISDPGVTKNADEQIIRADQAKKVIKSIADAFPNAELVFTFNNGINTKYSFICNNSIKDYLDKIGIEYVDMSGSEEKFSVYNDADMHIGFRVHSHIYSLSRRIPSILIEEDLRGWGMNETFGLPHLPSYDISERHNRNVYTPNESLITHLNDVISYNMITDFAAYKGTFLRMKDMYYKCFLKWADKIIE